MSGARALLAALLLIGVGAAPACADEDVSNFQLMRPVWALGFADAGWLFDYRGQEKHATVAVFPLAMTGRRTTRPIARATRRRGSRAIPLYVAERLFLETTCDVPVNMLVVNGQGPLVSGDALTREALVRIAGSPTPTVLVSGTLAREEVPMIRVTIEVQTPDGRRTTTATRIGDEPTLDFVHELVDAVVGFVIDAKLCQRTRVPTSLDRPRRRASRPARGRARNCSRDVRRSKVMPVKLALERVGMMACTSASHRAAEPATPRLIGCGRAPEPVVRRRRFAAPCRVMSGSSSRHGGRRGRAAAPFVYAKAGKPEACETAKTRLAADKDPNFSKWLAGVQCRPSQIQAR